MARWLEFKALAPNLVALEERARGFDAEYLDERTQQDLHLDFPDGQLMLRRYDRPPGELITYRRGAFEGLALADVEVAEVGEVREVAAMLRGRFGVRVEVEKTRRVFQWRATRIHLDQVFRLGMYVEVVSAIDARDEAATAIELREALVRLGLEASPPEPRSYADLILATHPGG
jgi:predicted adenylyl cyclase CyaB